jgi:hypothetical protein
MSRRNPWANSKNKAAIMRGIKRAAAKRKAKANAKIKRAA